MLQVSQPRLPCFKLGIKFGDQRFVSRFAKRRRSGFYCRVLQEGMIKIGQTVAIVERSESNLTVTESFISALHGA
jgi:MOSC domain-containing protein YiiM